MARRVRKSRAENIRWNQMIEALRLMNFGLNNIRLYPPTHSEVVGALKRLSETLGPILEEQDDVGFGFMDELLYIEGSMSIEETVANQMLVDRFSRCRVKYLTLMKGVSLEDLSVLFQILNAESLKPTGVTPAEQLGLRASRPSTSSRPRSTTSPARPRAASARPSTTGTCGPSTPCGWPRTG
ncbi:MAG: hypothetical protein WC943_10155 [Elusimicrobiota bacterium]|jgi:hypothetical protein